jgi:hypothetical protein
LGVPVLPIPPRIAQVYLAAQVLIADLVAERCFWEVARAKVDRSGAVLGPGQPRTERIERETRELSKKYGQRVHKALVDENLIQEDRAKMGEQTRREVAAIAGGTR